MNAVIYARYSSYSQGEKSIEGQMTDCTAYAERENLTVVGTYIDRAITGKTDDRPQFLKMIRDARKRQFERVIVWRFDRFARNRYDSAIYKHELKKYGVRVISVCEEISDSPEGILLEALLEASAEYYSAELSVKINRGMRTAAMNGTYLGGSVPYGYRVEDKRLVVYEPEAEIVRFVFEQYASGVGKADIYDKLTKRGLKPSKSSKTCLSFFNTMLHNQKYIGNYMHGENCVSGGCPAIVDLDIFDAVQARLKTRAATPGAGKAKVDYLLQGKLFCGMCGEHMNGECGKSKTGVVHYYYSCKSRKKYHTCKKRNEKKDFLEWYVVEQTQLYVLSPERIDAIADAIIAQYEKEFDWASLKRMEAKSESLQRQTMACLEQSIQDGVTEAMQKIYHEKMQTLIDQKEDLDVDISKLRIACKIHFTKEQVVAWLKNFCFGDPLDMDFRRKIIEVFVNSVYLYDDKLIIYYNLKNSKQVSYIDMLESTELEELTPIADSTEGLNLGSTVDCLTPLEIVLKRRSFIFANYSGMRKIHRSISD